MVTAMTNIELKEKLKARGVSQREVASKLIDAGLYTEEERASLKVRMNMALSGKRNSETYVKLLDEINQIVFGNQGE